MPQFDSGPSVTLQAKNFHPSTPFSETKIIILTCLMRVGLQLKIKNLSSIVLNWPDKGRRGTWLFCFLSISSKIQFLKYCQKFENFLNLEKILKTFFQNKHLSILTQNRQKLYLKNNVRAIQFKPFLRKAEKQGISWLHRPWLNVKIAILGRKLLFSLSKIYNNFPIFTFKTLILS